MLLLVLFVIVAGVVSAQNPGQIVPVTTTPSGDCGSTQLRLLTPDGTIYTCQNGKWGTRGGGGTGAANQYCTFASGATGCQAPGTSIDVHALAAASEAQLVLQCSTVTTGTITPVASTFTWTTGSGIVQTVVPAFSATSAAGSCVVNGTGGGGGGSGTVTSITVAGTTGQITVTGTCTITTTGTCTFSLPSNVVLPGTINSLTLTTSTGTITLANAKTFTVNAGLTLAGTDGVTITFPASNATVATLGLTNAFTGRQDASGAASTAPMKKGAAGSIPGTCIQSDLYFATDATAGQQIYECSATNTWTQQLNSGGGSGLNQLTGDVTAGPGTGSQAATVKGLNGVPLCTGFTPTNGQLIEYTTGGSPNPCYTAASTGSGNVQFQSSGSNVGAAAATFNVAPGAGILTPMSQGGGVVLLTPAVDTSVIQSKATEQAGTTLTLTETSTSGTAYTFTMSPTLTAYTTNMRLQWKVGTAITGGATTVNVDTLGAKSLFAYDGSTNPSAIAAGTLLTIGYDGTAFRILSVTSAGSGTPTAISTWLSPFGWILGSYAAITTAPASTNQGFYFEILVPYPGMVINYISANANGSTSGHVAWGLYNSTCSTLISTTNTLSSLPNGSQSTWTWSGNPVTLTPGKYFVFLSSDATTTQFYANGDIGIGDSLNGWNGSTYLESASNYHIFTGNPSTGTTTIVPPGTCGTRSATFFAGGTGIPVFQIH